MSGIIRILSRRGSSADARSPSPEARMRLAIGAATALLLSVLLSIHFLPDRVSILVGERSPVEIRAARSVSYTDTDATLRRQLEAARFVPNSYDFDRASVAQASRYVTVLFDAVQRVRALPGAAGSKRKIEVISQELAGVLTAAQLRFLLTAPESTMDALRKSTSHVVEVTMERGIRSDGDDLQRARTALSTLSAHELGAATDSAVIRAVGIRALRPDQLLNLRRTRSLRDAEMRRVAPVGGEVHAGEVIVRQGEIFTQLHMDKAKALGLVTPRLDLVTGLAILGLSVGMVALVAVFIRRWCVRVYAAPRLLVLLAGIVVVSVFGLKLFGQVLGIPLSMSQLAFAGMMMVTAAGMLTAVMLDISLAVLVTALLSVLSGVLMNHELRFSVMTLISSLVGILCVADFRDRRDAVRTTAVLGATNVGLVWVLGGLLGDTFREVTFGSVWALLSAGVGVGLFLFGVVALEKPFGVLTHAWLLELSASEHPLLRELCFRAPGTYAHSIMVGNLAEAAAESVGANALFCRVASYYHDIGKLRQPHCFVENQHGENIHDRLKPSLSALIIVSHVRDGLELAERHRLPSQIKAVIAEHHGTSLIQYFYHQALGIEGHADPVLEQRFRYEGPLPQTRESGIIMLADTVEAAVRCLERPTPARVQGRVEELIHQKLMDGQLDECELTFRDIGTIQSSFVRILSAMHHGRVDYPQVPPMAPGLAAQGLVLDVEPQHLPTAIPDGRLDTERADNPRAEEAASRGRTGNPPL